MQHRVDLPRHEKLFHFNMVPAVTRPGFATVVNVSNYFNSLLFGDGYESAAVLDIKFFDEDGRSGFHFQRELKPWGNLHIDIAEELRRENRPSETMGTVYSRLIPVQLPAMLKDKRVSTELTAEISTPGGGRDFVHNTGGPSYVPMTGRYTGGLMFADRFTDPCYIVLINKYLGPRLPYVAQGFAKVGIINHRGEMREARSEMVPARGMRLFSVLDHFPDIYEFLEGECGRLNFRSANLAHKPWVWFGARDGKSDISIDHT